MYRAEWVLLKRGGKTSENVFEEKSRPLPIPKEGLGIVVRVELKSEDMKRNINERFHNITGNIYENIDDNIGRDATSLNVWVVSEVALRVFCLWPIS